MIYLKKIWILIGIFCLSISLVVVEAVEASQTDNVIIFIDPGHGGFDGGAIGADGTYESGIVLAISLMLEDMFINDGYQVLMTRREDVDLAEPGNNLKRSDIYKRVEIINESNAEICLSIHANSFPNSYYWGAQTFFKRNESKSRELAVAVQDSLIVNLLNTYRLAKHINDVYLIDHINIPGCLIEVGFLSNHKELELLKTENYQREVAYAIYLGVKHYLDRYGK